ncbi:MAG: hypothetical protein RSE93_02440 [Oscillospiraceae bacterium]
MFSKSTSKKIIAIFYLILAVLVGLFIFFEAPNLNPLYPDGAFFWLVLATICIIIPALSTIKLEKNVSAQGIPNFSLNKEKLKIGKGIIIPLAVLWGIYFIVNIIFNPIFFWKSYRDQLQEPIVKEFTSDVAPIDINQIPVVDKSLAKNLADKKLGEKPSLGSQVVLGEPTLQNVAGELIWAVPLQHSGFFKWISNIEGSAGYIKISATNLKDMEYVEDYKIKIQPNNYFLDDLSRKVRFNGNFFTGITDYSFELNDDGKPFWVVTTYKNICGFRLPEATGVIIVDAQTGVSQTYNMNNIPEWVDRVQPEEFLINQINNKGEYIKGIFNFSNAGKYRTSPLENIVYNDGNCYLFTGLTSVGVDESATGFIMIDMVTKEPILYRMSGATESSAMRSAQGEVQDLGYSATVPIILNVYNQPTYFMTLKDGAGLIKKYAFVSIKDYMIVGVGSTVPEAKAAYAKSINNYGKAEIVGEDIENLSIVGTINRINFTIEGENTVYIFTLDSKPGVIFKADLTSSNKLPITQKGDSVRIKYTLGDIMQVTEFENTSF